MMRAKKRKDSRGYFLHWLGIIHAYYLGQYPLFTASLPLIAQVGGSGPGETVTKSYLVITCTE